MFVVGVQVVGFVATSMTTWGVRDPKNSVSAEISISLCGPLLNIRCHQELNSVIISFQLNLNYIFDSKLAVEIYFLSSSSFAYTLIYYYGVIGTSTTVISLHHLAFYHCNLTYSSNISLK